MLDVIALEFDYQEYPLLSNVSFQIPAGGLIHLQGANGVGKTTLLKLIAGLYSPDSGAILLDNFPVTDNLAAYQKTLCYVGHKTGINPYLTVAEHCFFDLKNKQQDINELLQIFGLQSHKNRAAGLLSAGQRRQIALLRLWMAPARLWLLDEPLVALDAQALAVVMDKIASHREQGGMVLLSSHQTLPLNSNVYQEYCL